MTTKAAPRGRPPKNKPAVVVNENQNKKVKLAEKIIEKPVTLPLKNQNLLIRNVLDRLDGKSVILYGIDRTRADLMSNLKCAVNDNRGNSSILIGPRASGKSTLVKQLIKKTIDDNSSTHLIEHLTLQGSIFSETQSVLKHLLARFKSIVTGTSVVTQNEADDGDFSEFMAFDQLTALVKQYFAASVKSTKRRFIIFVLEDLEKFAAHPQQNLLYCLFELALALPVFVISTSCRIDVLELLEKRVKSRFSQNIVYLPLPPTIEDFLLRIKANLLETNDPELGAYNSKMEQFLTYNVICQNSCHLNFELTKDVRPVFRTLSLAFASIDQNQVFDWNSFSDLYDRLNGPLRAELSLNTLILDTTIVEMMILVAMCRLVAKFSSTPVTFDVMAEELGTCKLRAPGLEHFVWTKSTLQVAFDRLLSIRLLLPTSNASISASASSWLDRSYLTVRLGLPVFIILDSIEKHKLCSPEIFALACEKF